jgi:ubiquinol-cytochrome c reductase iron-sulfur subunit
VRALGRWLLVGVVLLLSRGRGRRRVRPGQGPRPEPAAPRDETLAAALLLLAALAAAGFIAEYALGADTQLLGVALGLAFAFLSAAAIVTGQRLVPDDEAAEPYGTEPDERATDEVVAIVRDAGTRVTRKRMLVGAASGAGLVLGAALVVPLVSLGPVLDPERLRRSPWRSGRRLVNRYGAPIRARDVVMKSFVTAFPEGADHDDVAAPLIVIRVEPHELQLPPERSGWTPEGLMAFSKICTHAGCAVAMYRAPLYAPTSPRAALVCPCHYSTFDPRTGGKVIFGPAGRDLPQLPLAVDRDGNLVAAGDFSGPVGPSWWGVRLDS